MKRNIELCSVEQYKNNKDLQEILCNGKKSEFARICGPEHLRDKKDKIDERIILKSNGLNFITINPNNGEIEEIKFSTKSRLYDGYLIKPLIEINKEDVIEYSNGLYTVNLEYFKTPIKGRITGDFRSKINTYKREIYKEHGIIKSLDDDVPCKYKFKSYIFGNKNIACIPNSYLNCKREKGYTLFTIENMKGYILNIDEKDIFIPDDAIACGISASHVNEYVHNQLEETIEKPIVRKLK